MLLLDTNVLVDAVHGGSPFHEPCLSQLIQARDDPSPTFLTWSICYEFLRVVTHARVFPSPLTPEEGWRFIRVLLDSDGFDLLIPTSRHAAVMEQTLEELSNVQGNLFHDLHTAVLMREHGVSRICTRDSDFRRFPFLTVVDPIQ